jgi:hypothetical protein
LFPVNGVRPRSNLQVIIEHRPFAFWSTSRLFALRPRGAMAAVSPRRGGPTVRFMEFLHKKDIAGALEVLKEFPEFPANDVGIDTPAYRALDLHTSVCMSRSLVVLFLTSRLLVLFVQLRWVSRRTHCVHACVAAFGGRAAQARNSGGAEAAWRRHRRGLFDCVLAVPMRCCVEILELNMRYVQLTGLSSYFLARTVLRREEGYERGPAGCTQRRP